MYIRAGMLQRALDMKDVSQFPLILFVSVSAVHTETHPNQIMFTYSKCLNFME